LRWFCPEIWAKGPRPFRGSFQGSTKEPSPRSHPIQVANAVYIASLLWRCGEHAETFPRSGDQAQTSETPSGFEMRFQWDHLLVENSNDADACTPDSKENYMLSNFES